MQAMVDFMIFARTHKFSKDSVKLLYRWKKNTTHKSDTTHNGAGVNHPGKTVSTLSPLMKRRLSGGRQAGK